MNLPTVKVGDKDLTVTQMLAHRKNRLNEMLPEGCGITGDQLFRIAQMEIMRNPDLAQCDPNSVMNAIYDSARLGLLIGREAHLVPFKKTCQMIPDYRGYITLSYRSGIVQSLDAKLVFPQDHFEVEEGSAMRIEHKPDYSSNRSDTEEILYVYAIAWIEGSPKPIFHVMNRGEIDRIRESSAMKAGIPWTKWADRMWLKTAIKHLCDKRLPTTRVVGLSDLIELDNRTDTGRIGKPVSWESTEDVEHHIDEETKMREEDLKLALQDAKQRQDQ